jgi:hypothetical protein
VSLLREAALRAGCEVILGLADVQETHGAYPVDQVYGYWRQGWYADYDEDDDEHAGPGDGEPEYEIQELIDSVIALTHWTGPDGAGLEATSLSLHETEVCASTASGDLTPYAQQYEGYMGNWGNTLDRWYQRAALVVWPREQAFANRAETSPAWALDELAAMAAAGDADGARAAAATLAPFWNGEFRGDPAHAGVKASGLLRTALRVADAVADAATAAMLLRPFRVGNLTDAHVKPFAKLADHYGQEWTSQQLRTLFGGDEPTWAHDGREVQQWAAERLTGLCAGCVLPAEPAQQPRSGCSTWRGNGSAKTSAQRSRCRRPATGTASSATWASRSPPCWQPPPRSGRPGRATPLPITSGNRTRR